MTNKMGNWLHPTKKMWTEIHNSQQKGRFLMKRLFSTAVAAILVGATLAPALAQDRPAPVAPPKTMGDEGKLPATGMVGGAVPAMGATAPVEIGPSKRMGDEGKLPATGAISGATPEMNAPAAAPAGK